MYWGPITSTIDWCEPNYVWTPYIAEFWNTLSNFLYLALGINGFYKSLRSPNVFERLLFLNMIMIGVGSGLFHGTLQGWAQMMDEVPMIWMVALCNSVVWIDWKDKSDRCWLFNRQYIWLVLLHNVIFTQLHLYFKFVLGFQLYFALLILFSVWGSYRNRRKVSKYAIVFKVMGALFWFVDVYFCDRMGWLHGHALWHLCTGVSTYLGIVMFLDREKYYSIV